jgi:hypothetical protein
MLHPRALSALVFAVALTAQSIAQTTVQGEPFGYVKMSITAGTGTSKKSTLLSIPLLDEASITGKATGRITGVTATTITAAGAGWAAGQLSTAATPHLIEITSGAAQGRLLLISTTAANTTDTVTIATEEATRVGNLTNLGIATGAETGDTYRIRPVDTLSSFFGTPQTTLIQGGTSASNADTIAIVVNGSAANYYYNTTLGRWARVALGNPDASNTPILPNSGVRYERLANTPLQFIVTGKVPSGQRKVSVKSSGSTILSPYWPVNMTLAQLALQTTPNWLSGASSSTADTVVLTTTTGSTTTFFYDGTNWRRVALGSPLANTNVVPVGASIQISKRGNAAGFAEYQNTAPYNLQ